MSTKSRGLHNYIVDVGGENHPNAKVKFALGDVVTTMIKCAGGETIIVSHDTNLPRPYSLNFRVQGTKGLWTVDGRTIYIEGLSPEPHRWEPFSTYQEQYDHPLWKRYADRATGSGHGGMDFFVVNAFIESVKRGVEPPIDVYDAAAWSVISPLSERSVAEGSEPMSFPDFTRVKWVTRRKIFGLSDEFEFSSSGMTMMMKRIVVWGCTAAWVLAAGCGGPPRDKKVLVIGIDGVRPDILAEVNTPNIDGLIADGTFVDDVESKAQTISGPGWSSMVIGAWPDKHLVTNNDFTGNNYAEYPDFLTRLELVTPEISTFAVLDWPPLGTSESGGPLFSDTIDAKLNFNGEDGGYEAADAASVAAAVRYLSNQDPDAAFVYIGNPDVAAHDTGVSPEYRRSIQVADALVGELLAAIRSRPTYDQEDWLILVSTDHGHKDEGGHGGDSPEEKTVFYLASGPSTAKGPPGTPPNLVDVAVTAMAHLGVEIDPAWQLDGNVVGLKGRN
jgi:hypothetical protein